MRKIQNSLQTFLPIQVTCNASDWQENGFELTDHQTGEEIGAFTINDKGELTNFERFLEHTSKGSLKKEELLIIADRFIDTFYPNRGKVELSSILELDDQYMIVYDERDERYGLFLHNTGFTITITPSGEITSFNENRSEYKVTYPEMTVTEKDALETYMKTLDFELIIQKLDRETYRNGDNQYHLTYHVMDYIIDIPVNGLEPVSIREEHLLEPELLKSRPQTNHTIYELIGIHPDYMLIDSKVSEGKRIEIWAKDKPLHSYSFDIEELEEDALVKLAFDDALGTLTEASFPEELDVNEKNDIGIERSLDIALNIINKVHPNALEHLKLETLEDDEIDDYSESEDDDEYFQEVEPTRTFHFHYFHNGVRVDQHVSYVNISRRSGKVVSLSLGLPSEETLNGLPKVAELSLEEATSIYKQYLKMELSFVCECGEDEEMIYSLSYLPSFPKTEGHVRSIEAVTGEAMYMDVGDALFQR
ncbi:DUF4901 domain-containing protein [Alkalicoccobacillus plakortidis]|uniref:DUF4901 domain-containing protein n=1 Tax=Alkalicoccobacillus plakortidis TaxID=444060 RepID=A0ABT0XQ78_9BACI|nr:DUF4901 domain-containing protein [Alkalicoccobacillus plakortidis]MCM2677384.1 DUF4901 domain-containing protein [Alkalicoccobacillus plakortidis]